ncbi:MAG: hypothetical protein QNJ15_09640 [Erythrobacter sp.]|nr:hypothetical protein [Erythrobacter sp.]
MSDSDLTLYVVVGFALIFPLFWLFVVSLISLTGGWRRLQDEFPDKPTAHVYRRLSMQSAHLGRLVGGVSYRNTLTIEVCEQGLRFSVWRIFAPFGKPLFFRWNEIEADPSNWLAWPAYRLRWGDGDRNSMLMRCKTVESIAEASRGRFVLPGD